MEEGFEEIQGIKFRTTGRTIHKLEYLQDLPVDKCIEYINYIIYRISRSASSIIRSRHMDSYGKYTFEFNEDEVNINMGILFIQESTDLKFPLIKKKWYKEHVTLEQAYNCFLEEMLVILDVGFWDRMIKRRIPMREKLGYTPEEANIIK